MFHHLGASFGQLSKELKDLWVDGWGSPSLPYDRWSARGRETFNMVTGEDGADGHLIRGQTLTDATGYGGKLGHNSVHGWDLARNLKTPHGQTEKLPLAP